VSSKQVDLVIDKEPIVNKSKRVFFNNALSRNILCFLDKLINNNIRARIFIQVLITNFHFLVCILWRLKSSSLSEDRHEYFSSLER
jgi:hypothetical protein